jgi:hypothetical protein
MGDRRDTHTHLVGKCEEMRSLGKPSIDRRIILKWVFRK